MDKIAEQMDIILANGEAAIEQQAFDAATEVLDAQLSSHEKIAFTNNYRAIKAEFGGKYSPTVMLKAAKELTAEQMAQEQEQDPEFQKQAELSYNLGKLAADSLVEKLQAED